MFCAKFGWNWPSGSGEEDKNGKVYNKAKDNNDNDGQRKNFDQKS